MMLAILLAVLTNAAPEILTVNADGSFSNTNVVGNLAGFAAAKAASEVATAVAEAAHISATNTEKIVRDGIAEIEQGQKIEYSDLFVWSAGAFSLSTNAACNVYSFAVSNNVTTNIDGVVHFAADISYWFSEDIGSCQPTVKYWKNLNATNTWELCVQDEPIGPFSDVTRWGLAVENAYRTRTWIPQYLQAAFFKVFTDSAAPGTGLTIDLVGGVTGGYTGELAFELRNGRWLYITVVRGVVTNIETKEVGP